MKIILSIAALSLSLSTLASELNFGLTLQQNQKILTLTKGEVDSRNIFVANGNSNQFMTNFAEVHEIQVLPPDFVMDYDPATKQGWWQEALKVKEAWSLVTDEGVTIAHCDAG